MKKEEKKYYFYFLICIFAMIISFFFLIIPLKEKISLSSKIIGYQKSILKNQEIQLSKIQEFQKKENFFQEIEKKILAGFVDPESPLDFFNYLEEKAKEYNLLITFLRLDNSKKEPDNFYLGFKLEGNFENILKFIKEIEQGNYFIEITNINFEKEKEKVSANLNIKVLSQKK
jgi:Tfp pilus assembly protein PilO